MHARENPIRLLITGGAGFIGANLVRYWLREHPADTVVTFDKLLFGAENLNDCRDDPRHHLVVGDVCDRKTVFDTMDRHGINWVVHAAAQSHVDVSISDPLPTIQTNVLGTATLLEGMRQLSPDGRFHVVSTDEVYGSLNDGDGDHNAFREDTPYAPNNPYAASKAGSDHLARAYQRTFGLHVTISHCSNNYGPFQYPDKFIPKMICNAVEGRALPVYGHGVNVRDWLHVEDHCRAIDVILRSAASGESYCVGGKAEWRNVDLVRLLCDKVDARLGRKDGTSQQHITFVPDRPGHDYRYALDATKLRQDLGWEPTVSFEDGLEATVDWYMSHPEWVAVHDGLR